MSPLDGTQDATSVPREPIQGEQQEIEAQEAGAPLPEEQIAAEQARSMVAPASIEGGELAPVGNQNQMPQVSMITEEMMALPHAAVTISPEEMLGSAIIGLPNISPITMRLAAALIDEGKRLTVSGRPKPAPLYPEPTGLPPEENLPAPEETQGA